MVPGLEHRRIAAGDGTQLAYQVRGEGPAVVLANGLGGTYYTPVEFPELIEEDVLDFFGGIAGYEPGVSAAAGLGAG